MEKIESEKRKELRAQSFAIEGEILKTEMIQKEVEEEDKTVVIGSSKEPSKGPPEKKMIKKDFFLVSFVDGRKKEFPIVTDKPLLAGHYYEIKYNGLLEIQDIKEIVKTK